jgi:hypothetical protein
VAAMRRPRLEDVQTRSAFARTATVCLALAFGATLSACSSSGGSGASLAKKTGTTASSTHTLNGNFDVIYGTASGADGQPCVVPPGWGGEEAGDPVVVTNQSNTTIGTGTLEAGTLTGSGVELGCGFPFTVSGLPTASFYTVTVDQVGSNPLSLSAVENDNWNVSLSIVPPYPGG